MPLPDIIAPVEEEFFDSDAGAGDNPVPATPSGDVSFAEKRRGLPPGRATKPPNPADPTWSAYFARIRAQRTVDEETDVADEGPAVVEVLEAGHDVDPLSLAGKPGSLARRLVKAGWDVKSRESLAHYPAVLFLADSKEGAKAEHKKGDVRFIAHQLATTILFAVKRGSDESVGQMLAFQATWERKHKDGAPKPEGISFIAAETYDPILGREWRPTATRPRPPREWEAAEGIEGPIGFLQWLDIVCPK